MSRCNAGQHLHLQRRADNTSVFSSVCRLIRMLLHHHPLDCGEGFATGGHRKRAGHHCYDPAACCGAHVRLCAHGIPLAGFADRPQAGTLRFKSPSPLSCPIDHGLAFFTTVDRLRGQEGHQTDDANLLVRVGGLH